MYQGAKWILLKQKKRSRKSHAWAPLTFEYTRSKIIKQTDNSMY
jgi:hypothetical protein